MALPLTGIVHHISGPNTYAHLKPLSIDQSVAGAKIPAVAFTALFRFNHPRTRTYVRLLGPCFKTGRREPFRHRPRKRGERSGDEF